MDLGQNINFLRYDEFIVGEGHPTLDDTANRPLLSLIQKFNEGADTQVARTVIKINSATDIEASVNDNDLVWYNPSTSKFEKAIDTKVLGFIDKTNLNIFIFGKYELISVTNLVPGSSYYLDLGTPGAYTTDKTSRIFLGRALSTTEMMVVSAANAGLSDKYSINDSGTENNIVLFGTNGETLEDSGIGLGDISLNDSEKLSRLDITNTLYNVDGDIETLIYEGTNNKDVLSYVGGDIDKIEHFFGSATKTAETTYTYDVDGNFLTQTYTEI